MGRAKKSVEVEAQVIARGNVVPMMTETESEETVQYVSDEDAAREDRLVSEIRMITEQTKQVVLFNSIEIGRRLTEAKAMVKRGTWGTWLKERVDYSQRTANNFMKIYQEYGRNGLAEKSQALANLSYTQALALIDLPEDERARFAEERKAGEMALRKLQEEVRQEKEKVTAVKELANRNAAEAEAKFADELKQKDTQMAKLTAEKAKVAAQIEVLEKRAAEAEKSNQKRQKEAIGIALEEERKKLDAAAEKQSELLKQIDELNGQRDRQVAEARRKAEEEMNAKFAKERAELEEKERAAKAVADVARKQIDAAKRQVTEAIENRELTGAIARAKFAIESALDAYSRAADTVIEVGRLDKVEASKLLDDMAESSQSIVAKFVKTLKSEARAASLALQRLLVANDMTLDEISLSDDAPEINETGEDVGKRVAIWVKALAYVIASNYRCESYFHVRHERDFWTNRQKITSKQVVFVGEAEDSVVAAGCFRATRHAIERCFTSYVDRRFRETGERIGKQSGSKNSYCLGFVEGLKQAYGEQVAADESFALAVVVPESVTRFINEQHDIKTEPKQRYIVSQDTSIHDAGAEDGYGYGKGDRIAEVV